MIKCIFTKRQIKSTLNSRKFKVSQLSYMPNIIIYVFSIIMIKHFDFTSPCQKNPNWGVKIINPAQLTVSNYRLTH